MELSWAERKYLLDLAKSAIEASLCGKEMPSPETVPVAFTEKRGAFVTLARHGRLRGCIGYIEARKPLYLAVKELAIAAAFHDTRFSPLKREELLELSIEISLLTPLQEINDVSKITVGSHGIYIVRRLNSGLLLPQVAVEHKWNRLTFLSETCRKAGLPPLAWKDMETKIYIFSATVFSSEDKEQVKRENSS